MVNIKNYRIYQRNLEYLGFSKYRLNAKKVKCWKYNSSLDEMGQNFRQFECYLNIIEEEGVIEITNLKPLGISKKGQQ